jgi:RNA polymerase sigma-70 factor (ECF subfamily)
VPVIESETDVDKFNGVYERYKGMMYRVAFSILNNVEDAEDAVQEAFFKLAKNIFKIDGVFCKKTETFLVILVRNVSIDIYRKNRREKGATTVFDENGDTGGGAANVTPDVLGDVISKEGYERLKSAVEGLETTYRDVMRLRFVYEWTNEEIADFLGITKNSVGVRVNRGRALVMEALEKEGHRVVGKYGRSK